MESKCTTRKAQNKQIRRVAHLPIQSGTSTGMATLLAQLQTTMRKAVARRPHLGADAPRVCRHPQGRQPPPPFMWHLLVAPPWRLHVGIHGNLLQTNIFIAINRRGGLPSLTHHTRAIHPLHLCSFYYFIVWSLAKLVIGDLEYLEDIWYDQYNVLHFDSCHVLHLVLVLILSMLLWSCFRARSLCY